MIRAFLIPFCLAILTACTVAPATGQEAQSCPAHPTWSGPSLRAPLDAAALPTMDMDLTRAMPDVRARAVAAAFDKGYAAVKTTLARADGVDAERLAIAVEVFDDRFGYWSTSRGAGSEPGRYWMASVTKMITATVILQMIDEGRLALDQTLDTFLPNAPGADSITIDMLLQHTSGLFSFNADAAFRASTRYHTPEELIAIAARHGRDFCPGASWNYSNTGYVVLAKVAEAVDGKLFRDIIEERIAEPLGLTSFDILAPDATAGDIVPAATLAPPAPSVIAQLSGAGGLAASPRDLLVFLHAHLTGAFIRRDTLASAVATLHPMFDAPFNYGRGLMVFDVPDPQRPAVWIGHSGGSPDTKALAVYDVGRRAFVVVSINVDAPAEAMANALLKALDAVG